MGASAFLKSVDFTAFAVNVKTIALGKYLYQSGHAIWCERSVGELITYLIPDCMDYSVKYCRNCLPVSSLAEEKINPKIGVSPLSA